MNRPFKVAGDCWRRRVLRAVTAFALTAAGAAHPYSLEDVLRLPLECLLRLEISPRLAWGEIDGVPAGRLPGVRRGQRSGQRFAWLPRLLALFGLLCLALPARAGELSEYRLKAAVLYNFALFTEWPAEVGGTLNLCVQGADPFGPEIDALQGKAVGARRIAVQRRSAGDSLDGCQIAFITHSAIGRLPQVIEGLRGRPVLTVADSVGAARQGVALNLMVADNKVSFEANLLAARGAGLNLNSRLLSLATEVIK